MKRTIWSFTLALSACHGDSSPSNARDFAASTDLAASADLAASDLRTTVDLTTEDSGPFATCTRALRADGTRFAAVSHPFDKDGNRSTDFELLALATDGTFTRPNTHFQLGVSNEGAVTFTPDGAIGYAVEDDGTLGIFAVSDVGAVTVVDASYKTGHSASQIVMGSSGDRLYFVDGDTTANGGGVYEAPIGCDGRLGPTELVTSADIPAGLVRLGAGDYAFYARTLTGASSGENIHRASFDSYSHESSVVAGFALTDPVVTSVVATADGKYVLFGDTNGLEMPDSIAIVAASAGLAAISMGTGTSSTAIRVNSPYSLVASPYNNAVLVVSDLDNAFYKLAYDPTNTTKPFTYVGAIAYKSGTQSPQLPGGAHLFDHGVLKDHVFVSELSGVRHVQFQPNGMITDLGLFDLGSDANSVGIFGIQP